MSTLYLGHLRDASHRFEIHALTGGAAFGEYGHAEIADATLYSQLLKARYKLLASGRPFFCTAITPDSKREIECNPHDAREGTVHLVALDARGEIHCAVSVAVDIGARDQGAPVGLPLENRWRSGDYPQGADLDPFRARYYCANYRQERSVAPWEMAELYRHFAPIAGEGHLSARMGLYAGIARLFNGSKLSAQRPATRLFLFDAINDYYQLYRLATGAVLREPALNNPPRLLAPGRRALRLQQTPEGDCWRLGSEDVSRLVEVPFPRVGANSIEWPRRTVPFIDGLVDAGWVESAISGHSLMPRLPLHQGLGLYDRIRLRVAMTLIAGSPGGGFVPGLIDSIARRYLHMQEWSFDG